MNILIDFAKTLGYKIKKDFDFDLELIADISGIEISRLKLKLNNSILPSHIYCNEPFLNKNLEEELNSYRNYYRELFDILGVNHSLLDQLLLKRRSQIRHELYKDSLNFLNKYYKYHKIYLVTDGKPSRRLTLDSLKLNKYFQNIFISDELGFLKNDPRYFKKIINDESLDVKNTILIDDIDEVLNTASNLGIRPVKIKREEREKGSIFTLNDLNDII